MILTFRPIKVHPPDWKPAHARRPSSPFFAAYSRTLEDLDRELRHLNGRDPFLQLDVTDADVRLDGQLRSSARPNHPGVILTFDTREHGPLIYSTDAFDHWHANLRAIALGLDCLRRVERYGIGSRGQQYAGYRELGTGIALSAALTVEEAARFLVKYGQWGGREASVEEILESSRDVVAAYFREAAKKLHPDIGGDPELFRQLVAARELLDSVLAS